MKKLPYIKRFKQLKAIFVILVVVTDPSIGQYCTQLGCALDSFDLSPACVSKKCDRFLSRKSFWHSCVAGRREHIVRPPPDFFQFDCIDLASDLLLQQASPRLRIEKEPLKSLLVVAVLVTAALQRYKGRNHKIVAMNAMMRSLKQTAAAMIEIHQAAKDKRYQATTTRKTSANADRLFDRLILQPS